MDELDHYAGVCRVRRVMRSYLEALGWLWQLDWQRQRAAFGESAGYFKINTRFEALLTKPVPC